MAPPLIAELGRRRVVRAVIGYGVAAFAVLQIVEPIMHGLHWPDAVLSYVVVALAAGFPIVVTLAWIFDVNQGRIERTPPAPGLSGPRLVPILVALGLLAAVPGLLYYFALRPPRSAPQPDAKPGPSIAVLPLVNMSRDPDQDYFADGLAEELLDLLAKVPGLHVAARTSTFSFKGKNEDVRTIAEKLNVATLLEGSVRKAGDQVRITTQLINAKDGYHLWSETYDRKLTDVFAVQDEIAKAVVAALKIQLMPGQAPTTQHRTTNPEAYTQYLLGRQLFNRSTLEGYRNAADAFDKALALEPQYAPAWAGLAHALYWIADSSNTKEAIAEGQARALAAADKAVSLDPGLAEAYAARGSVRSAARRDWMGAKADFERALAIGHENADVLRDYTTYVLRPLGLLKDAVATASKVVALDPLNARNYTALGGLLVAAGKYPEAREALQRSLDLNPQQAFAPGWMAILDVLEGQPEAALKIGAQSTSPVFRLTAIALAEHAAGHRDGEQRALDDLIAGYRASGAYQIAAIYAWRGEKDRAFEWLDRAVEQEDGGLTQLKVDPLLRGLHADPRWPSLLKKLNLPL